ncbi:MAG: hybrid sensory histidine kinase BarA [Methanoregulaceae archaeon PtaB.Bin056]|nr:MAG: hybrid sensory histidine kinase BarA [Methanoregulaceae archaeon PtaB.Bin056]OPY43763.1 MAG: hybrid sensory histidine kinase BarA [Methanoregulaceae archaeon PtaU1.Bin222]HNQ29818.1 response regulator [Methanolinea sp.]
MKRKILYIEDNDQNYYLVSFILNAQGHTVTRARDGREGIDLATREHPDLILLDIQLPVMDGYATARELRRIPGVAATPIVALTSYAMAGDREKALEAGCTGYIEKPINPKTFTEQIKNYFPAGEATGGGG